MSSEKRTEAAAFLHAVKDCLDASRSLHVKGLFGKQNTDNDDDSDSDLTGSAQQLPQACLPEALSQRDFLNHLR